MTTAGTATRAPASARQPLSLVLGRPALTATLACYIIGPLLPTLGAVGDVIAIVSVALIALLLVRGAVGAPMRLPTDSLPAASFVLLLLATYAALIVVANGGEDTYYFTRGLRVLLHLAGGVVLATLYAERYGAELAGPLERDVFWVLTGHAAIILAEFLLPTFRTLVYAVTRPPLHPSNLAYRMAGLTNGAGAGTSVIQLIPLLLLPVLWTRARRTSTLVALALAACLNLASFILTGRTGLLLAAVIMPPLALAWRRQRGRMSARRRATRTTQIAIAVGATVVIASAAYGLVVRTVAANSLGLFLARATLRTFSTIVNLEDTGSLHDETVDALVQNHLMWPESPLVLAFGNSFTARTLVDSDIGYVRYVFGLGLVGVALHLLFYGIVIGASWRRRRVEPGLALPSVALAVALILANGKEPFLLTRYYFSVTVLLYVGLLHVAARRPEIAVESASREAAERGDVTRRDAEPRDAASPDVGRDVGRDVGGDA